MSFTVKLFETQKINKYRIEKTLAIDVSKKIVSQKDYLFHRRKNNNIVL